MVPMIGIHQRLRKDMLKMLPIARFLDKFIPAYPLFSNKSNFKKDAVTYNRPWIMDEIFNNENWTLQNTKMRSILNLVNIEETAKEI